MQRWRGFGPAGALALVLSALAAAPARAQMPMSMAMPSRWQAQLSGSAFAAYTRQTSLRGIDGPAASGWLHGSLARSFEHGSVGADAMVTLDPLVQGPCGPPRVLAGWAVCTAAPLEDRSHAQPFVMRLGVRGERALGPARLSLDAALVGDPVLGVRPYQHRASAAADPISPVTMDELTPAHAVGGVVTAGVGVRALGLEASLFNGGAHSQDRWDLALGGLHSWATRARWTPVQQLELYGGFGKLQASGGHHEGAGAMTVSSLAAEWRSGLGALGELALGAAGSRRAIEEHVEWAEMLEGKASFGRQTVFARAERTDRSILFFDAIIHPDGTHEHIVEFKPYDASELAVGYSFRALELWRTGLSLGGRYGFAHVSRLLFYNYEGQTAHTVSVFLNLGSLAAHAGGEHAME